MPEHNLTCKWLFHKYAITYQKGQQKGQSEKWSFWKCRSPQSRNNHSKKEFFDTLIGLLLMAIKWRERRNLQQNVHSCFRDRFVPFLEPKGSKMQTERGMTFKSHHGEQNSGLWGLASFSSLVKTCQGRAVKVNYCSKYTEPSWISQNLLDNLRF